jgi:hydrogenase nickel incorporation protein HypA/HybF
MHEMSIMANILDIVTKTAQGEKAAKVTRIELAIGSRAGVVTDALTFAFEAMSPPTIAAGAELMVIEIPLCYRCPSCGKETTKNLDLCLDCDRFFEVVRGRELQITSIEIE